MFVVDFYFVMYVYAYLYAYACCFVCLGVVWFCFPVFRFAQVWFGVVRALHHAASVQLDLATTCSQTLPFVVKVFCFRYADQ